MGGKRPRRSWAAALVLTASIMPLPIAASIITAALYITEAPKELLKWRMSTIDPWLAPPWSTIVFGFLLTLIIWVLLSLLARNATAIDTVSPVSALHLKSHSTALEYAFKVLPKPGNSPDASSSSREDQPQYRAAHKQVEEYIPEIAKQIDARDIRWVAARGYLSAWNLLHRAEEAMVVLQSPDEVIGDALHDEMSLEGSGIASEADALLKLRTAVVKLSPAAAVYLDKAVPAGGNATGSNTASGTAGDAGRTEMEARDAIRDAKKTLNEYRDRLWEGLVTQRNQLIIATFITGLFTYFLLLFAIIGGAFPTSIKAAGAFYLAGALSGLFTRLYQESQAEKAVDDFNLTLVRILVTPFISGLAAVGGILLLSTLSVTLTQSPNSSVWTTIVKTFNLTQNGLGIVWAAVLGYAPNLFINALAKRAQEVATQLQNSTPQNQGTPAAGTPVQGATPVLATTPAQLTFDGAVGQPNDPPAKAITITNSGGGTLVWKAEVASKPPGGTWLTTTPATGSVSLSTPSTTNVGVVLNKLDKPVTGNTYIGTVTITATDNVTNKPVGTPQVTMVTLNVTRSAM